MKSIMAFCIVAFMAMGLEQPVFAVDMDQYHKHIGKFHDYLQKAQQARAKGDVKEADKLMAKADDEKALADVALNAPGRMLTINDPAPIVYHDWPYYDRYWGWYGRGPWWGYPGRPW